MPGTLSSSIRGVIACCQVTAQVGPTFGSNHGFVSVARNGAGDYTLVLQTGLNGTTEAIVKTGVQSAVSSMIAVETVDVNTLRVRTFDGANAAAERNFWLEVSDVGPVPT